MTEQHPAHDDLVALALRDVSSEQAAALNDHLVGCGACRGQYATIDLDLQQVLAATPSIAPPAGFSGRVLDRMVMAEHPTTTAAAATSGSRVAGLGRRSAALLVAAAMLVGALLGVGGTLLVRSPGFGDPAQVASVPLLTSQGTNVGSVALITLDGRQQVVVSISAGRAGLTYDCVIVDRAGLRRNAGSYTMDDQSASWVVPAPASGLQRVELVTASGKVWSSAGF